MKTMQDFDLAGRRVLIRQDLNVPIQDGRVTSDARLRAALPTLQQALEGGARVMVMSHLGRPEEGRFDPALSMAPVAERLGELLGRTVPVVADWRDGLELEPGQLVLLENVRFNIGEQSDDDELARNYAALCDLFVMDAFGTAHRAQASTHGVARHAPEACAGPLLAAELAALERALNAARRPLVAIVGGAKVSTKLEVLRALAQRCDQLIVGGGIGNTFMAAAGLPVGRSLCEPELLDTARDIMAMTDIPLPTDVVVASELSAEAVATVKPATEVTEEDMILDIGPDSARQLARQLRQAGTIIWNGPVGVFEIEAFGEGTRTLAQAIVASDAYSIVGGGDTLAAVDQYGIADQISYISTGGGAFLEYVEGKTLPAVAILNARSGRPITSD